MIIHGIFYMTGNVWKDLMIIHGISYMTGNISDDHSWNILHDWNGL